MKTNLSDLVVFGSTPAFAQPLHVGRPNIGNRQRLLERLNDLLDRSWLTNNGPFVGEFEKRIADLLGVRHCIAMCNGTVALEIAVRALGLRGEVIVPAFTFIATPHALQWQEITPIFCDIDPRTHTINPRQVERMITPHSSGVIGVHVWGRPCNVEALTEIANRHHLKLLFDAAHAFDCSHKGRMIGSFGDAEVFSFHATKFFNTFEGGAVVTNNDELAAKMRLMKNFGFAGYDDVIYIGTNGKMSEVSAVMGLTGLESLEEFVAINHRNYKQYRRELKGIPGVKLINYNENEKCNYQYIILEIEEAVAQVSRDQLIEILHGENVLARRYFYPGCHRMEPYRSLYRHTVPLLPETERLVKRVFSLPAGTAIGESEISQVCQILRLVIENASEVSRQMDLASAGKSGGVRK
jgi:dTDP-4-amino-4,6-dideoxygalactose transaminase